MKYPHVLYSAQSSIAYKINKRYYGDIHYLFAAPFAGYELENIIPDNPPSSLPIHIYWNLDKESKSATKKGLYISANETGLLKGVQEKLKNNVISEEIRNEIEDSIQKATPSLYRPIMYQIDVNDEVIPFIQKFPDIDPFSQEVLIPALPGKYIKVYSLKDS
jgi:hypothetical protein